MNRLEQMKETLKAGLELEVRMHVSGLNRDWEENDLSPSQEKLIVIVQLWNEYRYLKPRMEKERPHDERLQAVLTSKIEVLKEMFQELVSGVVEGKESFEEVFPLYFHVEDVVPLLVDQDKLEIPTDFYFYVTAPNLMDEVVIITDEAVTASELLQLASRKLGVETRELQGDLLLPEEYENYRDEVVFELSQLRKLVA